MASLLYRQNINLTRLLLLKHNNSVVGRQPLIRQIVLTRCNNGKYVKKQQVFGGWGYSNFGDVNDDEPVTRRRRIMEVLVVISVGLCFMDWNYVFPSFEDRVEAFLRKYAPSVAEKFTFHEVIDDTEVENEDEEKTLYRKKRSAAQKFNST